MNKELSSTIKYIVAIGVSTGGPSALQEVIPAFPADIPAAFLIAQHMPKGFTKVLADRLNALSKIPVKEAEDGEILRAGMAYISPGDRHMIIEKSPGGSYRTKLTTEAKKSRYRPSVDLMMESISNTEHTGVIAVIMTGMGKDGAEGIKKVKEKNNGYIIAQDQESCVVFGMPRAAIDTGMVDAVIPLNKITSEIIKIIEV